MPSGSDVDPNLCRKHMDSVVLKNNPSPFPAKVPISSRRTEQNEEPKITFCGSSLPVESTVKSLLPDNQAASAPVDLSDSTRLPHPVSQLLPTPSAHKAVVALLSHPDLLLFSLVSSDLAKFPDRGPRPIDHPSDNVLASVDDGVPGCSRR